VISFSEASGFRRKSAVFHRRGRRQESLRMLWTGKKRKIEKNVNGGKKVKTHELRRVKTDKAKNGIQGFLFTK